MRRYRWILFVVVLLGVAAVAIWQCAGIAPAHDVETAGRPLPLSTLRLPRGFRIETYARNVDNARSLTQGPAGIVFVGSKTAGKVHALVDRDGDHRNVEVITLAKGLNQPNGVAFHDGDLYVAEVSRVLRYRNIASSLHNPPRPVVVIDTLPTEEHHGWKFMAVGPDGKLYVPVGAPCNVCASSDPRFASILRMSLDGTGVEIFAHGIRNTVGFDWSPTTHELWFTDNGRDWLGNDMPPDELDHAPRAGIDFGFPRCHGRGIVDPDHGQGRGCTGTTPPALELGPHVAALGMRFYAGQQFPARYRTGVFIAEHGSWNRSSPLGYRVMYVPFTDGRPSGYEPFIQGWLSGNEAWGRPVDVLVLADGSMLVSDDRANTVYRVSYGNGRSRTEAN